MFRDGFLSEAAASNMWVVKDGKLMGTPPTRTTARSGGTAFNFLGPLTNPAQPTYAAVGVAVVGQGRGGSCAR